MMTVKTASPKWIGTFRSSCPPPMWIAAAAAIVIAAELLWFGTRTLFDYDWFSLPDEILLFRDGLIVCGAILFGVYRVLWFHPLLYSDYLNWLKMTPWRKGVSLPLGPVTLCVWDAVLLAVPVLLLMDGRTVNLIGFVRPLPVVPIVGFLMGYVAALITVVWMSDQRTIAYIACTLQALVIGFSQWPLVGLGLLLASLMVATKGLSDGWEGFPWDDVREARQNRKRQFKSMSVKSGQLIEENDSPDKIPAAELGWPFAVCSPVEESPKLSKTEKCQIVGLIGIWALCIGQLPFEDQFFTGGYSMLLLYLSGGLAVIRLSSALSQHAPPISLAGRLATGRFIIPQYDTPILATLAFLLVPATMTVAAVWFVDWPLRWFGPVILTSTLWAHVLIGPNVDSWKLTAPCRLTAGTLNKRAFDQLT